MSEGTNIGRLIVFEGPDGVGKSTLSLALANRLKAVGLMCRHLSFPGKEPGTVGRLVYDVHHDPAEYGIEKITAASLQALHIAAHLDAIEQRILPDLSEGHWVILDRFWWSTWVYGRVAGMERTTLDALIQVGRLHWKGARRCLLDRPIQRLLRQRQPGSTPGKLSGPPRKREDSVSGPSDPE